MWRKGVSGVQKSTCVTATQLLGITQPSFDHMKSFDRDFLAFKKSSVFRGSSKLACGPNLVENHYVVDTAPFFVKKIKSPKSRL